MNSKKPFFFIIFILSLLTAAVISYADNPGCRLIVFYSPRCSSCMRLNADFMPKIEQKYKDKIIIEYRDITQIENYKLLLTYAEKYNIGKKALPIVIVGDTFLTGEKQVRGNLEEFIQYCISTKGAAHKVMPVVIDLIEYFKSFSPLVIIFAGLIDGINPCAFTVMVFFVTFLAFQKYEKKEVIFTGIFFILAVFLTYLLLGLGLFNFLYSLRMFSYVVKIAYRVVAGLCFILGFLAIYDIVKFKKTQQPQGMFLRLPDRIKYYIQRIIGLYYRQREKGGVLLRRDTLGLAMSAVIAGFSISILEAVCTGQVYLPTIAFVFKISHLKVKAIAYLVLYNLMFIVPLVFVFLFALLGASSQRFSDFMHRHLIAIKILMAILFFGLGGILIAGL